MKNSYGLSISSPSEDVFRSGLFDCIEYSIPSADSPDFFENTEAEAA